MIVISVFHLSTILRFYDHQIHILSSTSPMFPIPVKMPLPRFISNLFQRSSDQPSHSSEPSHPDPLPREYAQTIRREKLNITWTVKASSATLEEESLLFENLDFKAGETIGLPTTWQFYIRLWKAESGKRFLSLFLRNLPSEEQGANLAIPLVARFTAKITHPKDSKLVICESGQAQDYRKVQGWGIKQLISLEQFEFFRNENDEVIISLEFVLFKTSQMELTKEARECLELKEKSENAYLKDIHNELHGDGFKDTILVTADGYEFPTHRLVLSGRSKVFKSVFSKVDEMQLGYKREKERQGNLYRVTTTKSADVIRPILCHIYSGILNQDLLDPEKFKMETAVELTLTAEELGLPYLANFLLKYYPGLEAQVLLRKNGPCSQDGNVEPSKTVGGEDTNNSETVNPSKAEGAGNSDGVEANK